ncbi:EAL domain-containing protein [Gallaecimonas pentaromativorans]|uniref:bifunctional diguanylate cyclase/phosphodiesterase n=1 Tax=Gallaecimonas pentaromativorans TaxID=584787 RepID=UPI003A8E611C
MSDDSDFTLLTTPPSPYKKLWLGFSAILVVLLAGFLVASYLQTKRHTEAELQNLSLALESQLDQGLIEPVRVDLDRIANLLPPSFFAQGHQLAADKKHLIQLAEQMSFSRYFDVLNDQGQVIFRSQPANDIPSIDKLYSPALFFRKLLSSTSTAQAIVIEPDRVNQVLHLAVPVYGKDKTFPEGWVATSLSLKAITALFAQLDIGKDGEILLRQQNSGDILLRRPALPDIYRQYPTVQADQKLIHDGSDGLTTMPSVVDDQSRLYSYRTLPNLPLVLEVGLSSRDYLAQWQAYALLACALCAILFLVQHWLSRKLLITKQREWQAVERFQSSEARVNYLLNAVGHPIFVIDDQGHCTYCNLAGAALFGFENPEALLDSRIDSHFIDQRGFPDQLSEQVLAAVGKGEYFHCEDCAFINVDGKVVPVEVRAYPNTQQADGAILTLQDISERRQSEERIAFMAYHDPLTGLPNRWQLGEQFDKVVNDANQRGEMAVLLYFDLDGFKTINDTLGHEVGDRVLQEVASRLSSMRPRLSVVARLGGDEYLALARVPDIFMLRDLLDAILEHFVSPVMDGDVRLGVTPSIGVAMYPEHGKDYDTLLKAADMALYAAKAAGRNTYAYYSAEMGEDGLRRLQIQTELRQAFENNELTLYYQPQFDVQTGHIVSAEALLRWEHPVAGAISPAEFIPAAEECGMIIPISRWVFSEACKQAVIWQRLGLGRIVIGVNCSGVHFKQGDLVADVKAALDQSGLDPALLELELTESMLIESSQRVTQIIDQLKALGVQLSIDDFGTGYSNLAYLKRFAVSKLKIDRSFVQGLHVTKDNDAIVRAIINLAHSFNLKVIAEGVESVEELRLLQQYQCDILQGFHFSRPLKPQQFIEFVKKHLSVRPEPQVTQPKASNLYALHRPKRVQALPASS